MSHDDRYRTWAPPPRRPSPPSTSLLVPALVLLGILILVVGGLFLLRGYRNWSDERMTDPNARPREVEERGPLVNIEKQNIEIYQNNSPSVVHITTLVQQNRFFGRTIVPAGTGSGFVWDSEGHIVTNYHVIKDASGATVFLTDKTGKRTSYRAWLVGGRPEKDLAVLWIDAPRSQLQPIRVGRSSNLKVGQLVYAIGNPYGLDQTLTWGIVSAVGREIDSVVPGRRIKDVIQTDAAINPGNSGGPLLDSSGLLVGVNTAIYSESGSSAGIGFAIPVDEVNRVVPELIRRGKKPSAPERKKTRPGLGIQPASDELARKYTDKPGVVIARVLPGTPAARAGLRSARVDEQGNVVLGDIIIGIDDTPIRKVSDLLEALREHRVGDKVTVHFLRDDQRMSVDVTLGEVQ